MGVSTYVTSEVLLTLNLTNAKINKKVSSCQNENCSNYQVETETDFCSKCGSKTIEAIQSCKMTVKDLIIIRDEDGEYDENLRCFQIFTKKDNVYISHLGDYDIHKDPKYDIHIYDESISKYNGNYRECFYSIFKDLSEEKKAVEIERFKVKNNKLINILEENNVSYKIHCEIVVSNS